MIFDIKLKGSSFIATVHKKLFENELFKSFEKGNKLTDGLLSYLGTFVNSEKEFGFGGCLKKFYTDEQEEGYFYYEFSFPKQSPHFLDFQKIEVMSVNGDESLEMRRFMLTVYVCGYYITESMYFEEKNVLQTNRIWEDQKITFNLHDNHNGAGYSIAGKLYPYFNRKYKSLDEERRKMLETYVHEEMKRCCLYFSGQELKYEQIHILDDSWFIQCDSGGKWANSDRGIYSEKIGEFSSHNIDHRIDQLKLFCAIVSMNTWIAEYTPA